MDIIKIAIALNKHCKCSRIVHVFNLNASLWWTVKTEAENVNDKRCKSLFMYVIILPAPQISLKMFILYAS